MKRSIQHLEEMKWLAFVDDVGNNSGLVAYFGWGQTDEAHRLVKEMATRVVSMTAPTQGSMIEAYGQAGGTALARELWRDIEESRMMLTVITLGRFAVALGTRGEADEAWRLIDQQLASEERSGCTNTVFYSTELKGFAAARRSDKSSQVYKRVRGRSIPCNTVTYACARYCAMGCTPVLLETVKESCLEPDIITCWSIVKGYCVGRGVNRPLHVLAEVRSDEHLVPEIVCNSILNGFAKQHCAEDFLRVLEQTMSHGSVSSNHTLSIVMKLRVHARRLSQGFCLGEVLSCRDGLRPNVQVFNCLEQACVSNRRLERALMLHDTMVAHAKSLGDGRPAPWMAMMSTITMHPCTHAVGDSHAGSARLCRRGVRRRSLGSRQPQRCEMRRPQFDR